MSEDSVKIGDTEYEIVAEQPDGGGDYEWSQVALIRRYSDGQLFLVSDGGCSCNGPWDSVGPSDLTPVRTWQDAVENVKADLPYFFTADDVARFAEKLMEFRPAPSAR